MTVSVPAIPSHAVYQTKATVAATALVALGVSFELLSRHSDELKAELEDWDEGRTFSLGILPHGPAIAVRHEGGRLVYLGRGDHEAPIKILFKNVDGALLVLTGQLAAHTAFAERRAIVHGPLDSVMEANRAMAIVVKYLFPGIMLRWLTKRMPTFSRDQLLLKGKFYAMLVPALAAAMTK